MNEDDPDTQRISLAIDTAIKALPPTTEVDGQAMGRWLKSEFPEHTIEELVVHVERHCLALGRAFRPK
jgi:hypothetical protein